MRLMVHLTFCSLAYLAPFAMCEAAVRAESMVVDSSYDTRENGDDKNLQGLDRYMSQIAAAYCYPEIVIREDSSFKYKFNYKNGKIFFRDVTSWQNMTCSAPLDLKNYLNSSEKPIENIEVNGGICYMSRKLAKCTHMILIKRDIINFYTGERRGIESTMLIGFKALFEREQNRFSATRIDWYQSEIVWAHH